jgi:hypothetical protein
VLVHPRDVGYYSVVTGDAAAVLQYEASVAARRQQLAEAVELDLYGVTPAVTAEPAPAVAVAGAAVITAAQPS